MNFVIETVGVHRLEAQVAVMSGCGHGVLQTLGTVQDGVLRQPFSRRGQSLDEILWSIVEDDSCWANARWESKAVWGPRVH